MEFLKDLFGGQALTFDQLQTAAQGKGFEVVNAAGGAYVPKADADNLRSQVSTLTGQLGEANKKLEGFDPEWKTKADAATQKLNQQKFDELPLHHPCSPWEYEEREDNLNEFIAEPAPVEDRLDFE